jgi:hypothetical protein
MVYMSSMGAGGNGRTLERCLNGSWHESSADGGTPGAVNAAQCGPSAPTPTLAPLPSSTPTPMPTAPTPTPFPDIHINEFLPNSDGLDSTGEWIELWNAGTAPADISGWKLDDAEGGSLPYTISAGRTIGPGGYVKFSRPVTAIALNNDSDMVRLLTPGGQVYESIAYENAPRGVSSNRKADGSFVWSWTPTPEAPNVLSPKPPEEKKSAASALPSASSSGVLAVPGTSQEPPQEPEGSITPVAAATVFEASASGVADTQVAVEGGGDERDAKEPSQDKLSANAALAIAPEYRPFMIRYAPFVAGMFGIAIAAALVRWKRRKERLQAVEEEMD